MAIIAFLEGGLLARILLIDLLMTILTVLMVGQIEFEHLTLLFQGTVTLRTLFYRLALLPNIFLVFVNVMALRAGNLILIVVFLMGEFYRPLFVRFIARVFNHDLIGRGRFIRSRKCSNSKKHKASEKHNAQTPNSLFHHCFPLLFQIDSLRYAHYH
jgi:hypothetical protein